MEEFMLLIQLILAKEKIEIICYSADFNDYYENEELYCHHYIVIPKADQKNLIDPKEYNENSYVFIDKEKKIVYLENEWDGGEKSFEFISIEEFKDSDAKILAAKIKHLKSAYNNEYNYAAALDNKLREIKKTIEKEIDVDERKISFYQQEKNVERVNQLLGKIEIAKKIREIIERKTS